MVFNYRVTRERDSAFIAEGRTVHAFTDPELRVLNILKTHRKIYDMLYKAWKE